MISELSDEEFSKIIANAIDELPEEYIKGLDNVAITYEDDPNQEQRKELNLRCHQSLFGLYQGIPKTKRSSSYNLVLPDKITIFKNPIIATSSSLDGVKKQVKHTLWHEIAHFYGLGHDEIHKIEARWKN